MKEWWNNLSLREKQVLLIGSVLVTILFIYVMLWMPLVSTITSLRGDVLRNNELLTFMKQTDKKIAALKIAPQPKNAANPMTGSLLTIVQKKLNGTPLVSALSQLRQVENDSVELNFQKVEFDKLLAWLITLNEEQNLIITQFTVTPSATPGIVTADVVLKKG